jgi:hypothetical protein
VAFSTVKGRHVARQCCWLEKHSNVRTLPSVGGLHMVSCTTHCSD